MRSPMKIFWMPSSARIRGSPSKLRVWKPIGVSDKLMQAWFATTNLVWRSTNSSWRDNGRLVWNLFWIHYYSASAGQNESGHILSESIMKYIGLSAPWFTKARKVTGLLEKIGPGSPNPDPLVLQRLLSGATIGKGKDILAFLNIQANAAAAGNQWLICRTTNVHFTHLLQFLFP